jgi:hypothetical protein
VLIVRIGFLPFVFGTFRQETAIVSNAFGKWATENKQHQTIFISTIYSFRVRPALRKAEKAVVDDVALFVESNQSREPGEEEADG